MHLGVIYIYGGHQLAFSYFEHLMKARNENRIKFDDIFCLDANPRCIAAQKMPQNFIAQTPEEFTLKYALNHSTDKSDVFVPDHTAQHILLKVFWANAARHTLLQTSLVPLNQEITTPFTYPSNAGALCAMSYATWSCPPECQEPDVCPHTNSLRDWDCASVCQKISVQASNELATYFFACETLLDHIVMLPARQITRDLQNFEQRLAQDPPYQVIVGTHSHCHGILGSFSISKSSSI